MENKGTYEINIYRINFFRNIFQYSIGASLFFFLTNHFFFMKFFLGMFGLAIAYHSVYLFNDLMDYEQDKRDSLKSEFKPLVLGKVKYETVVSSTLFYLIIGLSLSFLVKASYGILVSSLLLLNFLYSSKLTRLKETKLAVMSIILMQFLKFSSGWVALAPDLHNYPIVFIILMALAYTLFFLYYKQNITNFKDRKIVTLSIVSFLLYLTSILIYPFKLSLLLMIPFSLFALIYKNYDTFGRFKLGIRLTPFIYVYFIISILILSIPPISEINDKVADRINHIRDSIIKVIPEEVINNSE